MSNEGLAAAQKEIQYYSVRAGVVITAINAFILQRLLSDVDSARNHLVIMFGLGLFIDIFQYVSASSLISVSISRYKTEKRKFEMGEGEEAKDPGDYRQPRYTQLFNHRMTQGRVLLLIASSTLYGLHLYDISVFFL